MTCIREEEVVDRAYCKQHNSLDAMFLTCPFVHSYIDYQNCEHDILKRNEPKLMQICTSDLRGTEKKYHIWGQEVKGQGQTMSK